MAGSWEFTDHTADVGILARANSSGDAIGTAGVALFDLMVGQSTIRQTTTREIAVAGLDLADVLVAFLNELLYLFEVEGLVFGRFEVTLSADGTRLRAVGHGERFDPSRQEVKIGVKAATHHLAVVEPDRAGESGGWVARAIVDV
jgi:SHS2 domain-containing protein